MEDFLDFLGIGMHARALRQSGLMPVLRRTVDKRFRSDIRFFLRLQPVNLLRGLIDVAMIEKLPGQPGLMRTTESVDTLHLRQR